MTLRYARIRPADWHRAWRPPLRAIKSEAIALSLAFLEASRAVDALEDAGIASDDISVVGPDGDIDASGAAEGAGIGAAVGGVGGLLACGPRGSEP